MKVLLVLDQFDGANNGNTISARRLFSILKEHGHEVRIAAYGEDRDDKYGFQYFKIPFFDKIIREQGFIFAKTDNKKMTEAIDWADVVHVMMPFFHDKSAVRIALKKNKPITGAFHVQPENILFSIHLGNNKWLSNRLYNIARMYLFKHLHFIHCPSNMIKNELINHGYKGDLRVISNGISKDFYYTKREKREEFKDKYVIVMSGRFSREKRQDLLIDAACLSKYADKIQIFLAGQGPMKEHYEKYANKLKNPIMMKFLSKEELINLFGETDLYVHASDIEIEAMSCMEAFACGLVPVISNSSRSATSQFALDERSIFDAGNPESLAKKIDYWIEHEEERKIQELKYAEYAKNYDIEKCVNMMEEMFKDAIKYYSYNKNSV